MALTHGMNVAAVRASMKKIDSYASQLDTLKNQLNTEISNLLSIWSGQDANKFVNSDWPPHKNNMTSLAQALRSLSTVGQQQANEQENTSSR